MPIPQTVLESLRHRGQPDPLGDEQRRQDRITLGASVSVTVLPHDPDGLLSNMIMRVTDVSPGGIGLLYCKPLVIGSEVTVTVQTREGGATNLRCVVCSSKSVADSMYRIGVRFENVEQ